MNKEQIVAIIQSGHVTDGDLADALLAELAKVSEPVAYKHSIMGADYYKDHPSPYPITEEIPLYTHPPLPQPDLVAENERLKAGLARLQLSLDPDDWMGDVKMIDFIDNLLDRNMP